jgi:hypothetical protein
MNGKNQWHCDDCAFHEQIVILISLQRAIKKDKGIVSTSSHRIENTESVLSSSRPSLGVVSSWFSFSNTQTRH